MKKVEDYVRSIPDFPEKGIIFRDITSVIQDPEAIVELGAEKINQIWRDAKLRAVGMKRATTLCETAKRSIGLKKEIGRAHV